MAITALSLQLGKVQAQGGKAAKEIQAEHGRAGM